MILLFTTFAAALPQTLTTTPSVAVNSDGRLEIFARGSDGACWHNWQTSPGGAWSGWASPRRRHCRRSFRGRKR